MKRTIIKIIALLILLVSVFATVSCSKTENKLIKAVDIKLTNEEYAFVCKEGNTALVNSMNSFMAQIKESGEFDALVAKYFEGEGEKVGYPAATTDVQNTKEKFVVATNCPFEPFEYMEKDGLIYGLDIEIAAAYAKANGLELVVKNIGFDEIFVQVSAGYADIGMAGITVDAEREKTYDFTVPYYEASQKLIVLSDNGDFDKCESVSDVESILSSLNGVGVGYQSATTGSLYINGDELWGFSGFDNLDGKAYANAQVAVSDLINGNIYAVVLDEAPANAIIDATNEASSLNLALKLENFINTLKNPHYSGILLLGLLNTVKVAVLGLIIGIIIGTLIAIVRVAPKYKLGYKILDNICSLYTLIFRGTPIVAQLLIAYYVIIPSIGIKMDALNVGMIVFGMNSGAYVSEIMRGGINSVDKGQMEAGRALGLTYSTTMIKIVVPQAVKNILPTFGNEFISLIKETSVLSFIAVYDLYKALLDIGMVKYDSMIPYLMMGVIYIVLVLIISAGIKIIERRFAKSDRN